MITQVLGPPDCGKTLLVSLLASRQDSVFWLLGFGEHTPVVWDAIEWAPEMVGTPDSLEDAFHIMREVDGLFELVVVDSLASLPSHYTHRQQVVSPDLCFSTKTPVVVINQERYPQAPGGQYWHSTVTTYQLILYRRRPALYTHCFGDTYLIWWSDESPELRTLQQRDLLWLPKKGESFI